jgi:hypothetical protein
MSLKKKDKNSNKIQGKLTLKINNLFKLADEAWKR